MGAEATLRMILLGEDRSAGRTLKNVGDQGDRTTSKLHKLSNVAGKALAGGLLVAGAAAVKFARNAADDEAAARRMAIALHNTTGATKQQVAAVEDWISVQGKQLGISDDQLRPAMEKLVTATHDVSKAQSLASLAMDISAGTGKSLEVVSMALAKAQNGNVASLGRLGLKVKDADGKTKSLHDVTKDLAATYAGQASAAAESTAGKQQRLTVALDEAGETIGYKLIPFMLKLTEAGTAALGWMTSHGKLVAIIAGAFAGLVTVVWSINAAVRAYTAVQMALNAVMSANPIGLVVLAVAALVAGFIIAYKKSETFRSIVDGAMRGVATALDFVKDHWRLLIALILGPFGIAIGLVIDHFGAIKDAARTAIRFVVNIFLGMVGAIIDGAAKAFGWVPGLGGKLKDAAKEFDRFRDKVNAALDGIHSLKVIHLDVKVTGSTNATVGEAAAAPKKGSSAVGTRFWAGGVSLVGERGPELAFLPRGTSVATAGESSRMLSGGSGGDLGTVRLVLQSEDGKTLEQKFIKFQRDQGGRPLAFVTATR